MIIFLIIVTILLIVYSGDIIKRKRAYQTSRLSKT
jgi:competence protein ComGC